MPIDSDTPLRVRTTYNVELASQPDRTGRSSVMIRLYQKGEKPARVLTSVKLENADRYWNPKKTWGKWVHRHTDALAINTEILNEYNRIRDQSEAWLKSLALGQVLTPAQIAERFRGEISERYFVWVDLVLEETKQLAYSTYTSRLYVLDTFRRWAGEDLPVTGVTVDLVRRYQDYLRYRVDEKGKTLKTNTINSYFDRLDTVHKRVLIKRGTPQRQAGLLSPWGEVEPLKASKTRKEKLKENTIEQLATVSIESARRVIKPHQAFQIWMLSHFLAGMRLSDVLQLRYLNFTLDEQGQPAHLRYEMTKTGHQISFAVMEQAQQLLALWWKPDAAPTDYILPLLKNSAPYASIITHEQYRAATFEQKRTLANRIMYANHVVNSGLKQIEEKAELSGKLRMHNARHSFADLARRIMAEQKTITPYDIQMMMGHSKLKQIETYIEELSGQDATQPLTAVFGKK